MNGLRELQVEFQSYILQQTDKAALAMVTPHNMTVESRLQIYHNAYYLRLVKVLESDYPILKKIMGDESFYKSMRGYLDSYPSHHYSILTVGRHLSKYLKYVGLCHPSLADLAAFEWAMNVSLMALDAPVLSMNDLALVPQENWPEINFQLHPSAHVLQCNYNTLLRWQAMHDHDKQLSPQELASLEIHLFWRHQQTVFFTSISHEQYRLLEALRKGDSFSVACESMLDSFDEEAVVAWVAANLQRWVSQGILSNVVFDKG
jgi:hypothetical protein